MRWSESELEALYAEVYAELGMTYHMSTVAGLEAVLQQLDEFIFDWDYNALCERSAVRTAQRNAQGGYYE